MKVIATFFLVQILCPQVWGYESAPIPASARPKVLDGVGITERIGQQIDLALEFTNESGQKVRLGEIVRGERPIVFGLVYYECPNLCNFFLNGLTDTLKELSMSPGKEFDVVLISIDPKETPELAAQKKQNYLKVYGRANTDQGWHFLTGTIENIKSISEQVGFGFKWDPVGKQWAHASAAIVLTPTGQISRYLFGIMFEEKTLRLSLVEAARNKIGGLVERVLLFCYRFDPSLNKYSFYAMNLMRAGAVLMITIMGLLLIPYWRRNRIFYQGDSTV